MSNPLTAPRPQWHPPMVPPGSAPAPRTQRDIRAAADTAARTGRYLPPLNKGEATDNSHSRNLTALADAYLRTTKRCPSPAMKASDRRHRTRPDYRPEPYATDIMWSSSKVGRTTARPARTATTR